MRRILLILVLIQTIFIVGCTENNDDETHDKTDDKTSHVIEINEDDLITMEILDQYMFRDDVQYVDLRNFEARFADGFIYSFEVIPFFDYLDNRAFIRNDGYDFEASQLINEYEMRRLFDEDKSIFLFADGCIRSGYVKDILNYLGYEKVFVLGGYFEYDGNHKVLGDGFYTFGDSFSNHFYNDDLNQTFYVYGTYNMDRKINQIRFDIVDINNISLRSPNYSEEINYNDSLKELEDYIKSDLVTFAELNYSLNDQVKEEYSTLLEFSETFHSNLLKLIKPLVPK